jgi:hypothetical protein
VVQKIKYAPQQITYQTFDKEAKEVLRLVSKPLSVMVNGTALKETKGTGEGWTWQPLSTGGVLKIHHVKGGAISINLNARKGQI